jgi:phosphate transport system substrate-binding protein
VQTLPGTAAVVNAISKDVKSIGYGGIAYTKGIKVLKVRKDDKSEAFDPSMDNVVSGKYPISRQLFFYTVGQPEGMVKDFIDWTLGEKGQSICAEVGYYPIPKK